MTAPSPLMWLLESRAILGLGAYVSLWPLLASAPHGDGHPVMVLPGFMADDATTLPLRYFLKDRKYNPHRWLQGRNREHSAELESSMNRRVLELYHRYGKKVSLVGWSLGGVYAREIARKMPDKVRQVITLGSPFGNVVKASNIGWVYEMLNDKKIEEVDPELLATLNQTPPVPCTAIYTKTDGIVAWKSCMEQQVGHTIENVEVQGSHCGLGHNPAVLMCIADRLAQAEGEWSPFSQSEWGKYLAT